MKPIVIIAATSQEIALLEHALAAAVRLKTVPFEYAEGHFGKLPVIICAGGIGKINAAAATTALIERHQPRLVINTGCAGAYLQSGFSIGQLVVASEEFLGGEGLLSPSGWQDPHLRGIASLAHGNQLYHNTVPLSKHAAGKAMQ